MGAKPNTRGCCDQTSDLGVTGVSRAVTLKEQLRVRHIVRDPKRFCLSSATRMDGLLKLLPASLKITLPDTAFVTRLNVALALLIASESKSVYLGSAIFKILASLSFFFGGLARALHAAAPPLGKNVPTNSVWPMLKEFAKGKMWKEDPYAFWIVVGLGCSVLGDVLLIPSRETYFGFLKMPSTATPAAEPSETPSKKKKAQKPSTTQEAQPAVVAKEELKAEGDTLYFKAGTFFFALAQISYTIAFLGAPAFKSAPSWNWVYFGLATTFALGTSWLLGIFGGGSLVEIPKDTEPLVKLYVFIISGMVGVGSATDNGWQRIIGAVMFMISDLFVAVDVFGKKKSGGLVQAKPTDKRRGRDGWMFRSVGWVLYFSAQMVLAGSI
jgi:uncharacterized membrane protein YhhN